MQVVESNRLGFESRFLLPHLSGLSEMMPVKCLAQLLPYGKCSVQVIRCHRCCFGDDDLFLPVLRGGRCLL